MLKPAAKRRHLSYHFSLKSDSNVDIEGSCAVRGPGTERRFRAPFSFAPVGVGCDVQRLTTRRVVPGQTGRSSPLHWWLKWEAVQFCREFRRHLLGESCGVPATRSSWIPMLRTQVSRFRWELCNELTLDEVDESPTMNWCRSLPRVGTSHPRHDPRPLRELFSLDPHQHA